MKTCNYWFEIPMQDKMTLWCFGSTASADVN